MKYKITWKDIFLDYLLRFGFKGMPLFLFANFGVFLLIQFFSETSYDYNALEYVLLFFENIYIVLIIYIGVVFSLIALSYPYIKNNIIGEHEIYIEKPYFVWKSKRQEIKTQLSLFRNFKVKPKYLLLHFHGLQKAKIKKSYILEGENEFVFDMLQCIHETEHQKNH